MTTKFDIIKLKSLAAMGDVEAMYTLATNYLYGIGVEADLERAHSYLEKAVDKGFEPAKGMIETVFADKGNSTELAPEFKADIYEAFKNMLGLPQTYANVIALPEIPYGEVSEKDDDILHGEHFTKE